MSRRDLDDRSRSGDPISARLFNEFRREQRRNRVRVAGAQTVQTRAGLLVYAGAGAGEGGASSQEFWAISPPEGIPPRTAGTMTLEGSTATREVVNHHYDPCPGGRLCLCGPVGGQVVVKVWGCVPAPVPEPPPPPAGMAAMAPGAYFAFFTTAPPAPPPPPPPPPPSSMAPGAYLTFLF